MKFIGIIHQWFHFHEQKLNLSLLENTAVLKISFKVEETQKRAIRLIRLLESVLYGKNEIGVFILIIWRLREGSNTCSAHGEKYFTLFQHKERQVYASCDKYFRWDLREGASGQSFQISAVGSKR